MVFHHVLFDAIAPQIARIIIGRNRRLGKSKIIEQDIVIKKVGIFPLKQLVRAISGKTVEFACRTRLAESLRKRRKTTCPISSIETNGNIVREQF